MTYSGFMLPFGVLSLMIIIGSIICIHVLSKIIIRIREYRPNADDLTAMLQSIQSALVMFIAMAMLMILYSLKTKLIIA